MMLKRILLSSLLFLYVLPTYATSTYPAPIELLMKNGFTPVRSFSAKSKLTGYVIRHGQQYMIVYVTPDGQSMLTGEMIDENGNNLNTTYAEKYVPKPKFSQEFKQLEQINAVHEGSSKKNNHILYVFFDPNCIFCHLLWKAVQPYEKVGLEVRWVPVAFLKSSSIGRAAAIMTVPDPLTAFRENESNYANDNGGITPLSHISAQFRTTIANNNQLMNAFRSNGTPTLVWKDEKGHIQVLSGMPSLSDLPKIINLPMQANHDPELNRFN